jgi:hypothetical protein
VATTFPRFQNLPKSIRLNIWRQAASVPRTVDFFESHDSLDDDDDHFFDDDSDVFSDDDEEDTMITMMFSRTRPPAILAVSREARKLGLTIYKRVDEGIRSENSPRDAPIYINPEVDIMYRGKIACKKGDAFRARCKHWVLDTEPLAITRTLAVDAIALTQEKKTIIGEFLQRKNVTKIFEEENEEMPDEIRRIISANRLTDIEACVKKGLRDIIIVIGNDDDVPEVNLIPYTPAAQYMTKRDAKVIEDTEKLKEDIKEYWAEKIESGDEQFLTMTPPTITLMTIQRAPLREFHLFPRLPVEIQALVWKAAYETPHITSISYHPVDHRMYLRAPRIPALAHVCHESRRYFKAGKVINIKGENHGAYFNNKMDILLLDIPRGITKKVFHKLDVQSIGLPYPYCAENFFDEAFSAADAKSYTHAKEIVILIGNHRDRCEMTYTRLSLDKDRLDMLDKRTREKFWGAFEFMVDLKDQMQKKSKSWKTYQKRREKEGKSSPDWEIPFVNIALMKPISETISPYLY